MGQRGNQRRKDATRYEEWNYFVIVYNHVRDDYFILDGPLSKSEADRQLKHAEEMLEIHGTPEAKASEYPCLGEDRGDRMIRALVRCEHCPECRAQRMNRR